MFQIFTRATAGAKRILQIGLVSQDAKVGAALKAFVAARDGVELKLVKSQAVDAKAKIKDVSIFVYDLDATKEASMLEFDRFMRERPADIPVIVLSPALDDELVRWFLRLRVSDWIKTPLSPGELIAACGRVISQAMGARQDVRCVTMMGARGGVGTTTLAIQAAIILSGETAVRTPTCLVDLDLTGGTVADYLDLKAGWQLDEIIPNPDRLDTHMLDIMLASHPSGISVLSSQRPYSDQLRFDAEVITRVLDLVSQKFSNLVIDLPRQAANWTDSVLLGSNQVYVVTEFSIPGLKAAKRLVGEISQRFDNEVKPMVIVNKHGRSLFGSGISTHEVKEILQGAFADYVGSDPKLVQEAIDRGVPTTAIKPRNTIVKDLTKILKAK
jgi:pilus assembly protein CpaE